MSLVAYGSSDESEEESEDVEHMQNSVSIGSDLQTPSPRASSNACLDMRSIMDEDDDCSNKLTNRPIQSLFHGLPKPKQNICERIDGDNHILESHPDVGLGPPVDLGLLAFFPEPRSTSKLFLPLPTLGSGSGKYLNKKSGPVKITLPALSQFNDEKEDEPIKKKLKPSQKGSGLFAILPAPKNIKPRQSPQQPLVPYIFTKKLTPTPDESKLLKTSSCKTRPSKPSSAEVGLALGLSIAGNDSEDDEDKDFFSLNSVKNIAEGVITSGSSEINIQTQTFSTKTELESDTVTSVHCSNEEPLAFHSGFLPSPWANESPLSGPSREGPMPRPANSQDLINKREEWTSKEPINSFPQENLQLDAEAMQRLCGRRSKKQEPVEFIDVSGKEIMPDPKDWLVKQLSEEQPKMRSHSHKRNDGPTTQQRRKHQITYLAFQAKENELELKNQWSQNRMSRKQTQSKYGF